MSSYAQNDIDKVDVYVSFYTNKTVTVHYTNNSKNTVKFKPELILDNVTYDRYATNQVSLLSGGVIEEVFTTTKNPNPTTLSKYRINLAVNCQGSSVNCIIYTKEIMYRQSPPLPVVLSRFNATKRGMYNLLEWETASEYNSDIFLLERSDDAYSFREVTQIKATGISNAKRNYSFNDYFQSENTTYYRLKQVDIDGSYEFSNVVAITPSTQPLKYFGFSIDHNENPLSFIIFDSKGNITKEFKAPLDESEIDLNNGLNIIVLITDKDRYSRKTIKQ